MQQEKLGLWQRVSEPWRRWRIKLGCAGGIIRCGWCSSMPRTIWDPSALRLRCSLLHRLTRPKRFLVRWGWDLTGRNRGILRIRWRKLWIWAVGVPAPSDFDLWWRWWWWMDDDDDDHGTYVITIFLCHGFNRLFYLC